MAVGDLRKGSTSLAVVFVLQAVNGWVQGMGWPPCGKTMVHWFSTNERGLVVSTWNVSHNVGGALVATFALWGVMFFGDWGASSTSTRLIAAGGRSSRSSCSATRRSQRPAADRDGQRLSAGLRRRQRTHLGYR